MPDHTTNSLAQSATEFVGVDWGSSNFRLLEFGAAGVQTTVYPAGVANLQPAEFSNYLQQRLKDHAIPPEFPVLMCGMVGSRAGWQEAPYIEGPFHLSELGRHLVAVADSERELWIVPGIRMSGERVDVMRGEEVQALGWHEMNQAAGVSVVCLPGTHSKWLTLDGGRVIRLETALTGEVYGLLREQSLLVSGEQQWHAGAFKAGVDQASRSKGLLHALFSTRARVVADAEPAEQAASYLSGLLIGTELCEQGRPDVIHLIGASPLIEHYQTAAALLGIHTSSWDGAEMVGQGLQAIWRSR